MSRGSMCCSNFVARGFPTRPNFTILRPLFHIVENPFKPAESRAIGATLRRNHLHAFQGRSS
jgi:hypothetical protein